MVCAHSYGGVVASHALADARNLTRLIYLTALPLDAGESLVHVLGRQVPEWWDLHRREGYVDTTRPELFYTDCTPEQISDAVSRLTHQSWRSFTDPVTTPAWRTIPSTYVICTKDQAFHPVALGMLSARCTDVRLLPAAHAPFLSQPDALANLLRHELRSAGFAAVH